ncbi:uncharacterized protein LOC135085528 [Ostrinia nubilalis]|uniref:uncharacterized protein LOC135085528 n=1 Tax=Ostrinia nubilalis TaxID=29057 RepID=UPI00308230DD
METKSSVVKSKSSNSAKTSRSEHHNKKSRSNAEFQPHALKKRGVYVEKKTIKAINELVTNQVQERPIKAPPRPRPGNKKFLASVLTILSKSTTGTQYPDANDPLCKKKVRRHNNVRRRTDNLTNDDLKEARPKRKTKFRSKALNDEVDKEIKQEQVVVLQSKKDIIQTPSIYSENDSFNWSNLPVLVKKGQQNKDAIEQNISEVASVLAREIMEGRKSRKDKRVRIDDPTTLVAENKKEPTQEATNEKDKGLYNFFVDLLETTISVYNVKAEYDKAPNPPSDASSTKIPLEIDESVAKKLNVRCPEKTETSQPSNQFYCLKDLEFDQGYSSPQREVPLKCPRKKKFHAESFSFLRKPTTKKLKTQSVVETKKTSSRKEKKKTLLNLFKEQLRMDDDVFEEPQNLYQALQVIAQNKRRCQKTIHFEDSHRKHKDFGFPECMFKRRKVISPSTKSTKNKSKPVPYTPSVTGKYSEVSSKRKKVDYNTDLEDSYHSLEVYGYDYENPASRKITNRDKQLLFTYHSTPSMSAHGLGSKDLLDFTESDSLFFNEYCRTP